jgi:Type I phosphodiesterase / nucleotide pyrophosphatase
MSKKLKSMGLLLGLVMGSATMVHADESDGSDRGRHVLLLSIDGMHAVDLQNCSRANTCPNMAALAKSGITYRRTSTSKPSDSFPGLMSIVTGASPALMGVWYDVAYDRVLAPPAADTGNGLLHGDCVQGIVNGTRTEYEEGVDINQKSLNGFQITMEAIGRVTSTISNATTNSK